MKLIFADIINHYDVQLASPDGRRTMFWRTATVPFPGVQLQVRQRRT